MFILINYLFIIGDVSLSVINTTLMIVLKQLLSYKTYVFSLGTNGAPRAHPNIEYQLVVVAKVKRSGTSQFCNLVPLFTSFYFSCSFNCS